MSPNFRVQLTRTLTAVTALSIGFPALATATPAGRLSGQTRALDGWEDALDNAMDSLNALFMMVRTTGERDTVAESILSLYLSAGVPTGADQVAGRGYVRTIYLLLREHPEALSPDLCAKFIFELPLMYKDMGGDPLDLFNGAR